VSRITGKALRFWPLLVAFLLADCTSKRLAEEHLSPPGTPHEVMGEAVRFTLTYNDGAALGINPGPAGLKVLIFVSVLMVVGLGFLYRTLPSSASAEAIALALVTAGAVGNLYDRVLSDQGVVDFIDVGVGAVRFWTFNVADIGITLGALLLAWTFWRRENGRKTGVCLRGPTGPFSV
jgi:signal peptidase II